MGLFSDIYNTVAKFFRPQEEQGEVSKSVATNRLKLVLMQDRTNLTPRILEQMRGELIDLLSKYVELDKELLELNFEQEGDQVALMLSIPVIRAKDEDEIQAALESENNKECDESEATEESDYCGCENCNCEEEACESCECEDCNCEEETRETAELEEAPKPKRKSRKKAVSEPEELVAETQGEESPEVVFENTEA